MESLREYYDANSNKEDQNIFPSTSKKGGKIIYNNTSINNELPRYIL